MTEELPVFDRGATPTVIHTTCEEWQPPRKANREGRSRGDVVLMNGEPLPKIFLSVASASEVELFCRNGQAWYASQDYRSQHANDNDDWPLQKLLRTEGNDACLALAERYRDLHNTATQPVALVGREPVDLYEVQNRGKDGRWKGPKMVVGKRANVDTAPTRAVGSTEETKKRAAPVPRKWQGDWPILAAIDARRELAYLRGKLGFVPKILDAFEWAVCDGLTLAEIGQRLGAGSKGAKGEARARIFDGFEIVDRYWQHAGRSHANDNREECSAISWPTDDPIPAGYYRSKLHPNMIFPKAA